jgi:predicted CXXCH cytochrome family protein
MRYGWVLLVMAGASFGQEIDTAIVPAIEQRRSTILDQIGNREERAAFEALYRAVKPAERRELGRRFLQEFPQSVVLAQAYEIAAKAAIELGDYAKALDWGTDISRFHECPATGAYQINCAPCHTSQLRNASFAEAGVNCEMCHGPSREHVAAMKSGRAYGKSADESPVDFRRISAADYVAICAQCHMQSGVREPEDGGEINYSAGGERFYRVYLSRPYVDYSRRAFYKDGRFRETTFIVEAFLRSKCFRLGGATCGTCHDPHPADAETNTRSLKFGADSDRMCAGCHARIAEQAERHTHHRASGDGSRCVACHMPRTMNALLFRARSHQIDEIPDAEMTERFGGQESPNACLGCHAGESIAWVRRKLATW